MATVKSGNGIGSEQPAPGGAVEQHFDVIVVGSGFGGSVTALRLTEKGYSVGVIEAGRRFYDYDFATTSWNLRRFLWAPKLGMRGVQRIHVLPDVVVLAGAGVGGGSLNYANTLYQPDSPAFYADPQWAHITDWRRELAPHYDQAERMLGVVTNPTMTPVDEVYKKVAQEMGVGHTFRLARVGVFFGEHGARGEKTPGVEVQDPYFGGAGPRRAGCLECGACMVGCRHNAKNTLVKNYLFLAEQAGAVVIENSTVTRVAPTEAGYRVETEYTGGWLPHPPRVFTAEHVVFAAGTWGTQKLLHALKSNGSLPHISDRLGELTRTNSEALVGASASLGTRDRIDFTRGVAITSSFHPDDNTHIEPVRYAKGSNAMGLMSTLMTDGGGRLPRWLKFLREVVLHPVAFLSTILGLGSWSERTTIALTMQSLDNSITVRPRRRLLGGVGLTSTRGHGEPSPRWIPAAHTAARTIARIIGGYPGAPIGDVFGIPMTAHFLGGCVIGDSPDSGVIDAYHRMYGHPGLHIVDGSTVSANLGVNPALTITAQAERAMSMWPNKGDCDPRPPLGEGYTPVSAVAPWRPVVSKHAPAALRLPITPVRRAPSQSERARTPR
ncbi:MAG: GMC family oxidoreductase [Dermatophilus congolensis]|nr:GMC family oxidoreductase [Dermatophilus congolensis]